MIDLPRSTYYYQPKPTALALGDTELARLIEDIHDVFPGYGYLAAGWFRQSKSILARGPKTGTRNDACRPSNRPQIFQRILV